MNLQDWRMHTNKYTCHPGEVQGYLLFYHLPSLTFGVDLDLNCRKLKEKRYHQNCPSNGRRLKNEEEIGWYPTDCIIYCIIMLMVKVVILGPALVLFHKPPWYSPNWLCWFNEPETVPLAFTYKNKPTRPKSRTCWLFVGRFVSFTGPFSLMWTAGLLFLDARFRGHRIWNLVELRSVFVTAVTFLLSLLKARDRTVLGTRVTHMMIKICWKCKQTA